MFVMAVIGGFLPLPLGPALAGAILLLVAGILANREYARETKETNDTEEDSSLFRCIKDWWNANKKL